MQLAWGDFTMKKENGRVYGSGNNLSEQQRGSRRAPTLLSPQTTQFYSRRNRFPTAASCEHHCNSTQSQARLRATNAIVLLMIRSLFATPVWQVNLLKRPARLQPLTEQQNNELASALRKAFRKSLPPEQMSATLLDHYRNAAAGDASAALEGMLP